MIPAGKIIPDGIWSKQQLRQMCDAGSIVPRGGREPEVANIDLPALTSAPVDGYSDTVPLMPTAPVNIPTPKVVPPEPSKTSAVEAQETSAVEAPVLGDPDDGFDDEDNFEDDDETQAEFDPEE
jgi:hypothetical protein